MKDNADDKDVPVVVRLGVLTLFPLIESLANIKDANYQRLCNRTLDIVIKVLTSVPALALRDEPADVLDAFRDFIFGLVKSHNFILDSPEKAQAMVALVGLATSRGRARHLFQVIDILFQIHRASGSPSASPHLLSIGAFVKQISEFRRDAELPLPGTKNDEPFYVESQESTAIEAPSSRGSVACDGVFLFTHSSRSGLSKVGTGLGGTIKGYVYLSRPDAFANDKSLSLVWVSSALFALPSLPNAAPSSDGTQVEGRLIVQLDPDTLLETRRFPLTMSAVAADGCRLISDGRSAYLVGRKKVDPSAALPDSAPSALSQPVPVSVVAPIPTLEESEQMEVDEPSDNEDEDESGSESDSEDNQDEDDDQDESPEEGEPIQADYGGAEPAADALRLGGISDDLSQIISNLNAAASSSSGFGSRLADLLPSGNRLRFRDGQPEDIRASAIVESRAPSSTSDKFVVEVYDASTAIWAFSRRIDLSFTAVPKNSNGGSTPFEEGADGTVVPSSAKEAALVAALFDKSSFYTNGTQLVALTPPSTAASAARMKSSGTFTLSRARVFTLADGKPIFESSLAKAETGGSAACIDATNNLIWTFAPSDNRRVASWINLGSTAPVPPQRSSADRMQVDSDEDEAISRFSAEQVLLQLDAGSRSIKSKDSRKDSSSGNYNALDSLLLLLSNMDRLAKHHPLHSLTSIVDSSSALSQKATGLTSVSIDPDRSVLHCIFAILQHALSCLPSSNDNLFVYVILSSLRLLKVNIHELITSHKKIGKSLWKEDADKAVVSGLRDLLLKFIEGSDSLPLPPSSVLLVQRTAASALLVGFCVFYPQPSHQAQFVLDRLSKPESFLLGYSLEHISSWYRASDLLGADEDARPREGPEVQQLPVVNKLAPSVLQSLVHFCLKESTLELSRLQQLSVEELKAVSNSTLTLSPSVRLLLALQRDVVAPSFGKTFVAEYVNSLLPLCSKFVEHATTLVGTISSEAAVGAINSVLQRSLIRVVLPSLATSLARKNHSNDSTVADSCVVAVLTLVQSLDKLCHSLPMCAASDEVYLRNLSDKREKKYVVETKHPYPFGKMQYKETVTIPGADKLVLRFDARSKTVVGSSDSLQLFLTPSLDTPVPNPIDGSAAYFNGTNFPRQPVTVSGNSVTFFFTQSRIDPSTPASARWGFRCTVAPVLGAPTEPSAPTAVIGNWLLDLENSIALVAGRFLSSLIEGEPVLAKESASLPWLSSPLFRGGLDSLDQSNDTWLEQFASSLAASDFGKLYSWMKSLSKKPRPMIRKSAQDPLERVEKFIIAALLKHTGIVSQAQAAQKQLGEDASKIPETIAATFSRVVDSIAPILASLYRRGDVEKDWQVAVEDSSTDFSFFAPFQANPDRLMELCEMHGVEFDVVDTNETVKRLFAKLQEEAAQLQKLKAENSAYVVPNPYETICGPVVERCRFLFKLVSAKTVAEEFEEDSDSVITVPAIVADAANHTGPARVNTTSLSSGLHPSSLHPLSKSATQPPSLSAKERAARMDESRKGTQDFGRRVDDLRKWLGSYSHWKNWQESSVLAKHSKTGAPGQHQKTAVDSVLSFVDGSANNVRDFEKHARLHASRAVAREKGLKTLSTLLESFGDRCFGSLQHQLLSSLRLPLRDGGHYLDNIQACGEALRKRVCDAFKGLFSRVVDLAANSKRDPVSRLLAMRICTMTFLEQDVAVLMKPSSIDLSVFELLQRVLLESAPEPEPVSTAAPPSAATPEEDDGSEDAAKQRERRKKDQERQARLVEDQARNLKRRYGILRDAAWTSLRLLATQAFGWSISSEAPAVPKSRVVQVSEAQEHVYRLMSAELKRLSVNLRNASTSAADRARDGEQCFQLLSLIYLLGAAGPLAQPENVENLLSILTSPFTAPRSQRLILRLFRRILPTLLEAKQGTLSADHLANGFLDQIASWVFKGKLSAGSVPTPKTEEKVSAKGKEKVTDSPSLRSSDGAARSAEVYTVHLHTWTSGHKRLMEVCMNTLGPEFLLSMAVNAAAGGTAPVPAGAGRMAPSTLDAKAQQFINDMTSSGSALIKQGPQDQCNRLAQALAAAGGTVTVAPVSKEAASSNQSALDSSSSSIRVSTSGSPSDSVSWESSHREGDTIFWVNGHVSEALGSEYIALVRFLMSESPAMFTSLQAALSKYATLVPDLIAALSTSDDASALSWAAIESSAYSRCLASLCVLSGFKESIHVGGKVQVKQTSNAAPMMTALLAADEQDERLGATVVTFDATFPTKVEVIFDADLDSHQVTRLDVKDARAIPEIPIDASALFSLTTSVLPSLIKVAQVPDATSSKQNKWLLNELRCRTLDALNNLLLESRAAEQLIANHELSTSVLPVLIKMAQSCDPAAHTLQLEKHFVALSQRLWDIQTAPFVGKLSRAKPMVSLLPHFPHGHKADLLPTAFEKGKQTGLIFWGTDLRTVEMPNSAPAPAPSGRGGRGMFGGSSGGRARAAQPTESLVVGNASVPLDGSIPEYYFEITIEAADSSPLISVGFIPDGSNNWGVGSYHFQANRVKSYYSGSNKRQEAYGTFMRAKDIIGCGWNSEDKTIYFARNGEDLGVAFNGVFPAGSTDRVVPAVGLGKGVKIHINFGQEPFKYNLEANSGLDDQTRETRRKEAEERRKKEIEEEEARRKKEKEADDAAKRTAAQPILNMGYTMKQALKALELTGFSGAENAVVWLLEHSDYNFDDEPDPDAKAEPPKPEAPAAEPEKPGSESSVKVEEKPADLDKMEVDDVPSEDAYDPKGSSAFHLGDSFSYDVLAQKEAAQDQGNSEWEDRVLPEVKGFMVKDGFSNLEVTDFMQQIRNELAQGHDAGAKSIVQQIMGDAMSGIRFPSSASARSAPAVVGLKMNQISIGMLVSVLKPQSASDSEPAPAAGRASLTSSSSATGTGSMILSTLDREDTKPSDPDALRSLLCPGAIGLVKAVQPQAQKALVEMYNPELAALEHWWIPVQALQKPTKTEAQHPWSKLSAADQIQQMLSTIATKLANVYARRIVISLIKNKAPLSFSSPSSGISVPDALNLCASEFLSATKVIVSASSLLSDVGPPKGMEIIRERLAGAKRVELPPLLVTEACSLLDKSSRLAAKSSLLVNSMTMAPQPTGAWLVEIAHARAVVVQFDRGGTNIHAGTKLSFYWDEECNDLIKSFPEKSPLMPLAVPSSKFFVRIEGKKDREKSKFKFVAVPVSTDASLARWLVEYLLETQEPLLADHAQRIFDSVVDFLYRAQTPSALKQSLMHLLARMMHRLRRRGFSEALSTASLKRLSKIKAEMTALHDVEKRRAEKPFSSYLQTLVELCVAVRMTELESKSAKDAAPTVKQDDAMFVAIALAKTLQAEKNGLQTKTTAKASSKRDQTSTEAQPSRDTSSIDSQAVEDRMPVINDEEGSEDSDGQPSFEGSFDAEGDDEDAMLKLALQESMRLQESSDAAVSSGAPKPDSELPKQPESPKFSPADDNGDAPMFDEMDVDDEEALRAAIAMSMAEGAEKSDGGKGDANKPEEKLADDVVSEKPVEEGKPSDSPVEPEGALPVPPQAPVSPPKSSDGGGGESDISFNLFGDDANISSLLGTPIPPPPPQKGSMGPPAPPSDDPAWFTQLVMVAQALEAICFRDDTIRHQTKVLSDLARKAWAETRRESIKERLVILEDIPSVPIEKRRDLMSLIEETVDECAQVTEGSLFVPVDHAAKMTRKFAVLELQSGDKTRLLIEKLSKDVKLRVPRFVLPGASLSASSDNLTEVKIFPIKGIRYADAEAELRDQKANASSADSHAVSSSSSAEPVVTPATIVQEYLKGKLFDEDTRSLTPAARDAFSELFVRYSSDHTADGVLSREQLDDLQVVCTGEKLSDEGFEYFVTTYETKTAPFTREAWGLRYAVSTTSAQITAPQPVDASAGLASPRTGSSFSDLESDDDAMDVDLSSSGIISRNASSSSLASPLPQAKEVTGLTLKGFLDLYTLQSHEDPVGTWDELLNLGYDLRLNLNSFSDASDAIRAVVHDKRVGHLFMDEELVRYAEQLYAECELTSPIQLTTAHVNPIRQESHIAQLYPKWSRLPLPAMRLRFEMLRQLNSRVQQSLPLVDLGGAGLLPQLLGLARGVLFHAVKMQFFYEILDKTSIQGSQPTVEVDRLRLAARKEGADPGALYGTEDSLLKNTAFGIVFNQLRQTDPSLFRQKKPPGTEPHFSLKVDFKGEHVEGEGGPYRQFFTDVSKELTKVLPLLIPCPNAQAKVGRNRDKFIAAPSCNSRGYLRMYRFLGQLMGMAIRTGVMLTVDLPSFFWKPLVEQPLNLTDLRDVDHAFYGTLKYIRLCERQDLEEGSASIFQKFTVPLSDKTQIALKPHGERIELTFNNKDEYLRLAEAARLAEASTQLHAIRRGLAEVVPVSLLNLCSWQDLEWRVCGRPQIDIKLLKRHTTYSGVSPAMPHIKYFWQVLKSLSQTDRRAFVRFAWAQERLPGDDQEFERTQTRMLIKPFMGTSHPDSTFPKADTCFFNLMLPEYSSPEVLRERLLFAIHTDADSMDADERNHEQEPEHVRGLPRELFFR